MELRKESVQMLRIKSKATSQVTFDVDYNVPDVKPDIGRMIQSKGEVSMDEVRLGEGKAFIKGNLLADMLYVGEEAGKVHSLTAKLSFEETLNLEGIVSGDKICLKWEIEDLSIHVIHSRKLNIKAIVTLRAVVDEMKGILIPVDVCEENVSVKKKRIHLMSLMVHKKDTLRIKDEMTISSNKPNIGNLLWHTISVRGLDLRPENHLLRARGELAVFALYTGDDEGNTLQWVEYALPFEREVECSGCQEEMIPNIETWVMHQSLEVKPDADGEERILVADVVLELDLKLYREEDHQLVQDVYSPLKECISQGKTETLEGLLVRNFSKCRVTDRIQVKETQGKILQLCSSQGTIKIDKTKIVENGIQAEGILLLKVLYVVGNDEMPLYSMEGMIPFTHVIEAQGIREGCSYYLQAELEQLSTMMADSNELEIRAVLGLNVLVQQPVEELIIDRIQEKPLDMAKIQSMAGITVYMVKPGESMWDIAKKFYTTKEEIIRMNELADDLVTPGQPLLLVKKV